MEGGSRNDLAASIPGPVLAAQVRILGETKMAVKKYIPSIDQAIRIAVTIAIVFFVLNNVAPESIKRYFRV